MEDADILALYHARDERAIAETRQKYGRQIYAVAYRILHCKEDAEECENDTYLGAWNTIPPERPRLFPAYLSRLVRNIAVSRARKNTADKRGGGEVALSLDELGECIPNGAIESSSDELTELLNAFLGELSPVERTVFLCRYFHCMPVKQIAYRLGYGQSKVKMMLLRTREKLREALCKEGYHYDK